MSSPPPLRPSERAAVATWQQRNVALFVLGMAAMVGLVLTGTLLGIPDEDLLLPGAGLFALLGAGLLHHLSGRCPRCGRRFSRDSRLVAPPRCRECGVDLR